MIPQKASKTLIRLAKGFPILVITRPRQFGKLILEKLDVRLFANQDLSMTECHNRFLSLKIYLLKIQDVINKSTMIQLANPSS